MDRLATVATTASYELVCVCMICGREYARKPATVKPLGPSHGICGDGCKARFLSREYQSEEKPC